jgi:uncharacterized membrane protein
VCAIAVGIFFRFACLDRKVYWYDETFTSLELSGYSTREASADILTGRVVSAAELEKYQFPTALSDKTAIDTINGLIANEPQLTPLYFVLARWWSKLFPESTAAIRALSAIFSVMALGLTYILSRELFSSPRIAVFSVGLAAVSPLYVLYAQEARPYALWCVTTLLSSIALLRAIRLGTRGAWALYSLSIILNLYTFLLSVCILFGHACFVAIDQRLRLTAATRRFVLCAAVGLLAFLPWPYHGQHPGIGERLTLVHYLTKWIRSIAILFADFNFTDRTQWSLLFPYSLLILLLLALVTYSIRFLLRHATRRQSAFLLTMLGALYISLPLLDVVKGFSTGVVTRYSLPSLMMLQLMVGYLLATVTCESTTAWVHRAWQGCALGVIALGVSSCLLMTQAPVWWSKEPDNSIQAASRLIRSAPRPALIVSDTWFVRVLSLEHKLPHDVLYKLTEEPQVPQVAISSGSVFVYMPSEHLRAALASQYTLTMMDPTAAGLWKVEARLPPPAAAERTDTIN